MHVKFGAFLTGFHWLFVLGPYPLAMLSPLRLFLVVVFRLLAPLHMMAADAGSSSEGGGSAKKRPATEERGEPGSLDTLWEGFMTAQVNATHSNLRAIAHAGRLDDMRKIIWSSYLSLIHI